MDQDLWGTSCHSDPPGLCTVRLHAGWTGSRHPLALLAPRAVRQVCARGLPLPGLVRHPTECPRGPRRLPRPPSVGLFLPGSLPRPRASRPPWALGSVPSASVPPEPLPGPPPVVDPDVLLRRVPRTTVERTPCSRPPARGLADRSPVSGPVLGGSGRPSPAHAASGRWQRRVPAASPLPPDPPQRLPETEGGPACGDPGAGSRHLPGGLSSSGPWHRAQGAPVGGRGREPQEKKGGLALGGHSQDLCA